MTTSQIVEKWIQTYHSNYSLDDFLRMFKFKGRRHLNQYDFDDSFILANLKEFDIMNGRGLSDEELEEAATEEEKKEMEFWSDVQDLSDAVAREQGRDDYDVMGTVQWGAVVDDVHERIVLSELKEVIADLKKD